MRLRFTAVLMLISLSHSARADMVTPGFPRVPIHYIFEVPEVYPEYQFWLVWHDGVKLMDLSPGKPFHAVGNTSFRFARVVAIPAKTSKGLSATELQKLVEKEKLPPEFSSGSLDSFGNVPFYDARKELVSTYRLTIVPGEGVRLEFLEREPEPWWSKAPRFAAGIFLSLGIAWAGYRLIRRLRKRTETDPHIQPGSS